jgi:uncharacterized membrane protein YedE/YeeE
MAALLVVGAALGATLHRTGFGFASAYRRWIVDGETAAIRAQLLMLALATVLFAPMLAAGSVFGSPIGGFVAPLGASLVVGAFVFGIGMQLAGGCGSGTLYTTGGGNARMAIVLVAFIAGSFVGSLHLPAWEGLPALPAISLGEAWGWPLAASLQLGAIGVLGLVLRGRTARHPEPRRLDSHPLVAGAIMLAVLNAVTLAVAGQPWGITWAFALWGAKLAQGLGWSPDSSAFWAQGYGRAALDGSIFDDVTSVMDIGLMLGAGAAAAIAGRFAPSLRMRPGSLAAAVLGGLAMGYGARLAYGCNVGAFFSGVASTSLHGWVWIVAALPGCWVGVKLRPHFGLAN